MLCTKDGLTDTEDRREWGRQIRLSVAKQETEFLFPTPVKVRPASISTCPMNEALASYLAI